MLVDIVPSTRPAKKLVAIFRGASGKTRIVHFGARGYKDFTLYYRDAKARARKNPMAAVALWRTEKGAIPRAPRSDREMDGPHDARNARALHLME